MRIAAATIAALMIGPVAVASMVAPPAAVEEKAPGPEQAFEGIVHCWVPVNEALAYAVDPTAKICFAVGPIAISQVNHSTCLGMIDHYCYTGEQ